MGIVMQQMQAEYIIYIICIFWRTVFAKLYTIESDSDDTEDSHDFICSNITLHTHIV